MLPGHAQPLRPSQLRRAGDAFLRLREVMTPRPVTGKLWLDLVWLLVVGALHHAVLPTLTRLPPVTRSTFLIDLMTPWLTITFVAAPLSRAALFALVGAMILETHSTAPSGLYITAYWVVAVVIRLTRSTLSWRHAFPWLVTLALAELWVMGFELFVSGVAGLSDGPLDFTMVAQMGLRFVLSTGIGMLLARRLMAEPLTPDPEKDAVYDGSY